MTRTHRPWSSLAADVQDALLALPADGLLELLVRDVALGVTWLLPDRLLLELSGAPPAHRPALRTRGWSGGAARHRSVQGSGRAGAAAGAAQEAVAVLRDVLRVQADDVELWRPWTEPPDAAATCSSGHGEPW